MNIKKSITYLAVTSAIFTSTTMAASLYVTINNGEVWSYDTSLATGAEIFNSKKVFVSGQNNPNGIDFDAAGNAYIVNSNSNEVRVYNRHGSLLRTVGGDKLSGPSDVTLDSNGNIYVANTQSADSNERYISKFDANGAFIKFIASPDDNYRTAIGITTDASDNLYVSFPGGEVAGIVKYTNDMVSGIQGDFDLGGDINGVRGLAVDSAGNLLATAALTPGPGGDAIYKFDTSPFPPATYDIFTPGSPFLIDPLGIATSPDGSMFVANTATPGEGDDVSRITKLDANGDPILQWFVGSPEFGRFLAFGPTVPEPSPIPEPSRALLSLVALGAVAMRRRRR